MKEFKVQRKYQYIPCDLQSKSNPAMRIQNPLKAGCSKAFAAALLGKNISVKNKITAKGGYELAMRDIVGPAV